jgi:hypothetical protein
MHRYKEYLRQDIVTDSGPQVVHLKYDVKIAKSTRILDDMKEIQSVQCTNSSLTLILTPEVKAGLMSQEFQLGSVVAGGREWGCLSSIVGEPGTAIDFTRKVRSVSTDNNLHLIVLGTTDSNPFDAFEEQDIDIWSENVLTSDSNLRSKSSSRPQSDFPVSDTSSTRLDLVDVTQTMGPKTADLLSGEIFLEGSATTSVKSTPAPGTSGVTVTSTATATAKISLAYRVDLSATFRFRVKAGLSIRQSTGFFGFIPRPVPTLFEYECWIDEQITFSAIAKASVSMAYTRTWTKDISRSSPILAFPMTIGGIGVNAGLFANLKMQMHVGLSGMFDAEVGMVVSRTKKYGSRLSQSCSDFKSCSNKMVLIDEGGVSYDKIFDWGGKVVAVIKPSIELGLALKLGIGVLTFDVGIEMRSGVRLYLEATFSYGLGNKKQVALTSSQVAKFWSKSGPEICEKPHEARVNVTAGLIWTGLSLSLQPFYSKTLKEESEMWTGNLFLACYDSGGVVGQTLPYEKIAISCGVLQVVNGISLPSTNILFGDSSQILCNAGYGLSKQRAGGSMQPTCTLSGTFSPSWECVECQPGTYSSTETSECLLCPANSISTLRSSSLANCACNAGFSGPNGGLCVACMPGKYKAVTGAGACSSCPLNYNSPAGSSSFSACTLTLSTTISRTVTSVAVYVTTPQPTTSPQQVVCACLHCDID